MRIAPSLALLLLAACSDPGPRPAEASQARPPPEAPAETDTELRDAVQAPIDRAKSVEQSTLDDADQQRQDIEDAGG